MVRPSKKSTVPVRVPGSRRDGRRPAVNVTVWPKKLGLAEEVRMVVVWAGVDDLEEELAGPVAKLVSPEKAVIEWVIPKTIEGAVL